MKYAISYLVKADSNKCYMTLFSYKDVIEIQVSYYNKKGYEAKLEIPIITFSFGTCLVLVNFFL